MVEINLMRADLSGEGHPWHHDENFTIKTRFSDHLSDHETDADDQRRYLELLASKSPIIEYLLQTGLSTEVINQVIGYCAEHGCSSSPSADSLRRFISKRGIEDAAAELIASGLVNILPPDYSGLNLNFDVNSMIENG